MLHRVCVVASGADVVLLRQGRLARHAPVTTTLVTVQPLQALLQKPLRPFVDKAAADPDRDRDVGDRDPSGDE